jgi:transposase-like protein
MEVSMGRIRRSFTREFKLAAIREVEAGKPIGYVARQLEVSTKLLHRWKKELRDRPSGAFSGNGKRIAVESREAELERKIGQMTMENDFLEKLLSAFEEREKQAAGGGQSMKRYGKNRAGSEAVRGRFSQSIGLLPVPEPRPSKCGGDGVA